MASASSSSGISGTCLSESSLWGPSPSSRSDVTRGRSPMGGRLTTCRLFRDLYTPLWLLPATLFFSARSYSDRSWRYQQHAYREVSTRTMKVAPAMPSPSQVRVTIPAEVSCSLCQLYRRTDGRLPFHLYLRGMLGDLLHCGRPGHRLPVGSNQRVDN